MSSLSTGRTALVALLVVSVAATAAFTGTVAAHENTTHTTNETATDVPPSTCSDPPRLAQARLHAPQTTITTGQHGTVAGGFQVPADAECPIVVAVTMSVPPGMTIAGASDVFTGGAGLATVEFTVGPGEVRDIRANVYSERAGRRTVTADITYWPQGNPELSRELDGITLTFDVHEPHPAPDGSSSTQSGDPVRIVDLVPDDLPVLPLVSVLAMGIVGLVAVLRGR